MRSLSRVSMEAVAVGIIIILLLFIVHPMISGKMLTPSTKGFREMVAGGFLVGVLGHLILELIGANEQFCKTAGYPA